MDNQPIKLTPLFQDFNCRSILSPALKIAKKDIKVVSSFLLYHSSLPSVMFLSYRFFIRNMSIRNMTLKLGKN